LGSALFFFVVVRQCFLLSLSHSLSLARRVKLNTFAVNYTGLPFTCPLRDHRLLWGTLRFGWLVVLVASLGVVPHLGRALQLAPLPRTLLPPHHHAAPFAGLEVNAVVASAAEAAAAASAGLGGGFAFRVAFVSVLALNLGGTFAVEQAARRLA
jgi:hypothetical protein